MSAGPGPEREVAWLRRVRDFAHELAAARELSGLLPRILEAAIELTRAERGFLVRVLPTPTGAPRLRVEVARGFPDLERPGHVSRTVVQRVLQRGDDGLVTTVPADQDVLEASSVLGQGVRCIACVPLRLRGETRGVLYLDHGARTDAFLQDDLPGLATFASQAALALETAELRGEGEASRARSAAPPAGTPSSERSGPLVGDSPPMRALHEALERAARSWEPVLVVGEPGTGKRLVARELHARGSFPHEGRFEVDCSSPEAELSQLLFGPASVFLRAGRGTVTLARPERLPRPHQDGLLRLLREGRLRPPGALEPLEVRARVVALATPDLRPGQGLRADLHYRLDVLRVAVPPLRERSEDIAGLIAELARRHAPGRELALSDEALELLRAYPWPGNVRELENEVRRLLATNLPRIPAGLLSPEVREGARAGLAGEATLRSLEREAVVAALEACRGNRARAARRLGVSRSTLYRLLERFGLSSPS